MQIDGKKIALAIEQELGVDTRIQTKKVCFVLFNDNPASVQFVAMKSRVAKRLGIEVVIAKYTNVHSTEDAVAQMNSLVEKNFDGIVVQLPLPVGLDTQCILDCVPIERDIDVLSEKAKQAYKSGVSIMIPPVANAVWEAIQSTHTVIENKKIVLVGNGKLVGEPVANLFIQKNIPYSIVDKETDKEEKKLLLAHADVIISGVGIPHGITQDMIQEGVILIDAGTSEQAGKMVGDIDPVCYEKASWYTPVPGGIGPITVVSLFKNLLCK